MRFDDTDIPGLLSTIGYVDATRRSPQQVATLTLQKIGRLPVQTQVPVSSGHVPGEITQEETKFEELVEDFENAGNFAAAKKAKEALLDSEILMRLSLNQVKRILNAYLSNDQVRHEFGMTTLLLAVWNRTSLHTMNLKDEWAAVYRELGETEVASTEKRLQLSIQRKFPTLTLQPHPPG